MSKFILVKEMPSTLKKGEYVVDRPNFLDEIALHKAKAPRNNLTGPYHLRMIFDSIVQNYSPDTMTAYSIKVHKYEGRPFTDDNELNNILVEIVNEECPDIFTKFLDKKVKLRPKSTDLIYVVKANVPFMYETLYQNGLSEVTQDKLTKEKSTKVVGKPAVTKEQTELLKQQD